MALRRKNHPGECSTVTLPALILLLTLCTVTSAVEFAGGTGDPNDPYQIATADQLIAIGSDPNLLDKHFVLVADIDLGAYLFSSSPIVPVLDTQTAMLQNGAFQGVLDGNCHVIRNLTINGSTASYMGLFGSVGWAGQVRRVGLEGVTISVATGAAGSLVGLNGGRIIECYATGSLRGPQSDCLGGLVGNNIGGMIMRCYTDVSITGQGRLGGLVGDLLSGTVAECFAAGLLADYVAGPLSSPEDQHATRWCGGLIGIARTAAARVRSCYYLRGLERHPSAADVGTMLTDSQMSEKASYRDWDFVHEDQDGLMNHWFMQEAARPVLTWQTNVTQHVIVPPAVGLSLDQAQSILQSCGLSLGSVEYDYHETLAEDQVAFTRPIIYAPVGGIVDVTISHGPYDWSTNPGDGTEAHPYEIETPGQMRCLGRSASLYDRHFVLIGNLDMRGQACETALVAPDPTDPRINYDRGAPTTPPMFSGLFDGGGHTISNLHVQGIGKGCGVFGAVDRHGRIQDLCVQGIYVCGEAMVRVGGLVGHNGGEIINCRADAHVSGLSQVGALVGANYGQVTASCAAGLVSFGDLMGGLAGVNLDTIADCYASSSVDGRDVVGGLVGDNYFARITTSYSSGQVNGTRFGGLVGRSNHAVVESSFWNVEASGVARSDGGTGLATTNMQASGTFIGASWDFESVWMICEGRDYPRLRWEGVECEAGH